MSKSACGCSVLGSMVLYLCIVSPIIIFAVGCSSGNKSVTSLSRRDYLPEFYDSGMVLGGASSDSSELFVRAEWPDSAEAMRAVKSSSQRTYERSHYYMHTSTHGRPYDNFSYRIVTTDVK
ncbi:MAG: hypothetical protein JW745_02120 [Sedimentisphaerales bacterium]|nr:hypothetical protein [Sedimentisphaerales bacterium]MBN2842093.1 hypothetical protein [Sedimentisphaerales bacterium]